MKSGPVSQIISGVTFGKSIPGSLEALEQGSVSTIERKMGQKYRRTHICMTHFGPLLPNCKSGMLFLGQVFGLACEEAKSWLG